jgi:hypothetical protein
MTDSKTATSTLLALLIGDGKLNCHNHLAIREWWVKWWVNSGIAVIHFKIDSLKRC